MRRFTVLCSVIALVVLYGCGGEEKPPAPTSVTMNDLQKDGAFWLSLTPDLKDELSELCKQRLGDQRAESSGEPTVSNRIQAISTEEVVRYVDKQYANTAKRNSEISINCGGAVDEHLQQQFNDAIGQLGLEGG